MPDAPSQKHVPHPHQRMKASPVAHVRPADPLGYAEIQVTTNFTFLTGASHPEEFAAQAAELGYRGLAITDTNTLAGAVRMHVAAKEWNLPLAIGCRLLLQTIPEAAPLPVLVYPTHRAAYGGLCQLLTRGKLRSEKGKCHLTLHDLLDFHDGLLAVVIPPAPSDPIDEHFIEVLRGFMQAFTADRFSLGASCAFGSNDRDHLARLADLSDHLGVPLAATNDVQYHAPVRKPLHDVLACIRHGVTLDGAGFLLKPNAEQHLKSPAEMHRLFAEHPRAIERSVSIIERASAFSLDELRYEYPHETCPADKSPMQHLTELVWAGAAEKYAEAKAWEGEAPAEPSVREACPQAERTELIRGMTACAGASAARVSLASARGRASQVNGSAGASPSHDPGSAGASPSHIPGKIRDQLQYELNLIAELNYPHYFLTVHDIVAFARSKGIICQGRGAAANSAVCFCLGVTEVDPARFTLLFERFISRERDEPPDIDVDFEHERREEVIQYIYGKYGRHRAALTAEVITYRSRSAIRDVGKALGLSLDCVDRLAKNHEWFDANGIRPADLRQLGLDPSDGTFIRLCFLVRQILGFPRHLSQHVGGFVLTDRPLCETVPIENAAMDARTVIEWDKDDIDALGMLKVDVLGLGMLTCVRKSFDLIALHCGPRYEMHSVPAEDPAVYDMVCKADTVGVFQIESRAQMSMLPRLRPQCFYDLVIEVAIVRPGPIQGGMVHPYLRRRTGEEKVSYPSEAIRDVLERTLGVPLFQEQAMAMAVKAAGFTPGEADALRRSMAAWKRKGHLIAHFGEKIISGMLANGYEPQFAQRCFEQIKGFGEYGFPESHAASFALIVYVSAWLKCHHPAAFAAALINSQPMGFYAPAQIVRDARDHGVEVLPIDVNHSAWDCTLEPRPNPLAPQHACGLALRLGTRLVKGLRETDAHRIHDTIADHGPFRDIESLWRASAVPATALRRLAAADAFTLMRLDRQRALWQVRKLHDIPMPLFDGPVEQHIAIEDDPRLPLIPDSHRVLHDYVATSLSLKSHPMAFLRSKLDALHVTRSIDLHDTTKCPNGKRVHVAGLVLVRQRPGTASGIVFITLEDETGIANLIIRAHIFDRFRKAAAHGRIILATGTIERDATGQVVHVLVRSLRDIGQPDSLLKPRQRNFH